jgi:DNA-binding NarL/FixJ family response regulator
MERAATEAGAYDRARAALAVLSSREHDVAVGDGDGKMNAEIATELYVGVATVRAHITRILCKRDLGTEPRSRS